MPENRCRYTLPFPAAKGNCSIAAFRYWYQPYSSNTSKPFMKAPLGAIIITVSSLLLQHVSAEIGLYPRRLLPRSPSGLAQRSWRALSLENASRMELHCPWPARQGLGDSLVTSLPLGRDGAQDQEGRRHIIIWLWVMSPSAHNLCGSAPHPLTPFSILSAETPGKSTPSHLCLNTNLFAKVRGNPEKFLFLLRAAVLLRPHPSYSYSQHFFPFSKWRFNWFTRGINTLSLQSSFPATWEKLALWPGPSACSELCI